MLRRSICPDVVVLVDEVKLWRLESCHCTYVVSLMERRDQALLYACGLAGACYGTVRLVR